MSKRKIALEIIRIEYAKYGESTRTSMRAYVENRISMETYKGAAKKGMELYDKKKLFSILNENGGDTKNDGN